MSHWRACTRISIRMRMKRNRTSVTRCAGARSTSRGVQGAMSALTRRGLASRLLSGRCRVLVGLAFPLALLVAWEALGRAGVLPPYLVAPSAILAAMWTTAADGELFGHIVASMFRAGMEFLVGSA